MKKVAIISTASYKTFGGIPTYIRSVINAIGDKFELTNLVMTGPEGDSVVSGENSTPIIYFKSKKKLIKHLDKVSYDVIVDNAPIYHSDIYCRDNLIIVQHADYKEYWEGCKIFWRIGLFVRNVFSKHGVKTNILKRVKNVFFYSDLHNKSGEETRFSNLLPIPADIISIPRAKFNKDGFGIWVGRFDNSQKGILRIVDVKERYENIKLKIAGQGKYKNLVVKTFSSDYMGVLSREDVPKAISSARSLILTSKWEGFPYILVEALWLGIPIIIPDTFDGASVYKDMPFVRVFDQKNSEQLAEFINEFNAMDAKVWTTLSKEAREFAKNNFSIEGFKKSWIHAIESI